MGWSDGAVEPARPVHPRLGKKLLEGLAQLGSKVIERQSGDPPWQCLVSEPAMDRAGIDATRPTDVGKA